MVFYILVARIFYGSRCFKIATNLLDCTIVLHMQKLNLMHFCITTPGQIHQGSRNQNTKKNYGTNITINKCTVSDKGLQAMWMT